MTPVAMVLGIAAGLLLLWFAWSVWRFFHKANNVSAEGLRPYLEILLKRGYAGAFMVIEERHSRKFLQFSKYVGSGRQIGLQLGFPRAPWSEPYYEALQKLLRDGEMEYEVQATGSSTVREFIDVDCGDSIDMAMRLVGGIFRNVFACRGELRFRVRAQDIDPRDEPVDFKAV